MKVHNCNHKNPIVFLKIQHSIWKSSYQGTPDFTFHHSPRLWKIHCSLNCRINFQRKITTKTRIYIFIVFDRLIEFLLRFRVKRETHLSNLLHISSNTCCPGIASTDFDLSSAKRCFATSTHCLSIPGSVRFKLRSNESTTKARSSIGRDTAPSIISFLFIPLPVYQHIEIL